MHFRENEINGIFQCFFCLEQRKRQLKTFQKIIEILAGIRYRKESCQFFVSFCRKCDLLQCCKFFCNVYANAAVQMRMKVDIVIYSIFFFHRK